MAEVNLTGLSASDPIPGFYIQENFGAGDASAASTVYPTLIIANKLSTGSGAVDTLYGPDTATPCTNEADLTALSGSGSEAHRDGRRYWAVNKVTPTYFMFPAESAGAAATGTATFTTTATSNATARFWCGDEFVDAPINNGDAVATVATAVAAAINAKTHWPITAAAVAGAVNVTAKQKGLRGNTIRISAQVFPAAGMTVTPVAPTALTGGTTSDSWTSTLAAIAGKRFYYIVCAADDAALLGAVLAQVNSQAEPITGIRQRVFAGSSDTGANAITLATALNGARAELAWQQDSDLTPGELAANMAAIYSLYEASPRPRLNYNNFGDDAATAGSWRIKAPRKGTAPTRTQIMAALMNGVTPIGARTNGSAYLVKRITTRSLNGSTPDYRIRDAHKVTVCDFYADALAARGGAILTDAEIADDPVPGAPVIGAGSSAKIISPRVMKAAVNKLTREYHDNAMVQNLDTILANTTVERSVSNRSRLGVRIPIQPIDILDQIAVALDQVA